MLDLPCLRYCRHVSSQAMFSLDTRWLDGRKEVLGEMDALCKVHDHGISLSGYLPPLTATPGGFLMGPASQESLVCYSLCVKVACLAR